MNNAEKLKLLKTRILQNNALPFKKQAGQLVLGSGNPNAEIVFIGEAPGYWEDLKGEPFVGNAGKLFDELLSSIKVKRTDIFITNIVMYRPPANRDPKPEEIAAFKSYVDEILKIIKPKLVVTLGRFSMGKFIPAALISRIHGQPQRLIWQTKQLIILPLYHPAAGLRRQAVKQSLKSDFLKIPPLLKKIKT